MATEHIVITGRNGAGVSTTAVNLSAALAEQGYQVAHLGYDRRRTSSMLLRGSAPLDTPCDKDCETGCGAAHLHCANGYRGILCIECGVAPEAKLQPQFALMCRLEMLKHSSPDFVVHDLAGEPAETRQFLRNEGEPTRVLVVASPDFPSITTLNRFLECFAVDNADGMHFGGIVANNISGPFFETVLDDFLRQTGTTHFASIPHSLMVSAGEYLGQSVIESAPESHLSSMYRKLARIVGQGLAPATPQPLDQAALATWLQKWSEITEELECGLVRDGAAI